VVNCSTQFWEETRRLPDQTCISSENGAPAKSDEIKAAIDGRLNPEFGFESLKVALEQPFVCAPISVLAGLAHRDTSLRCRIWPLSGAFRTVRLIYGFTA
jgi:hypothetical protein